jgi:Tfp pilus assembly protein PilX
MLRGVFSVPGLSVMNKSLKKTKKNTKGFVLVLTIFVTMITATLIIAFLNTTSIDLSLVKNHMCSAQAYYIAEAGVADAIDQMRQTGPLADTQWEEFFPSGSSDKYTVSVSDSSRLINSTGLAATSNFSRTLEVSVNVSGSSVPYNVSVSQWKEIIQ